MSGTEAAKSDFVLIDWSEHLIENSEHFFFQVFIGKSNSEFEVNYEKQHHQHAELDGNLRSKAPRVPTDPIAKGALEHVPTITTF